MHAQPVWQSFKDIYDRLLTEPGVVLTNFTTLETMLTVNLIHKEPKDKTSKLLRTLTEIILHELWNSRCKALHQNIDPDLDRSRSSIYTSLHNIIKAHYKHDSKHNLLDRFKEKFCIKNVICTLDYHDNLNLDLPP